MSNVCREVVGKRVLLDKPFSTTEIQEAKVLDVSPTGRYVKLEFVRYDGTKYCKWEDVDKLHLLEVLGGD